MMREKKKTPPLPPPPPRFVGFTHHHYITLLFGVVLCKKSFLAFVRRGDDFWRRRRRASSGLSLFSLSLNDQRERERERGKEEDDQSGTGANHVNSSLALPRMCVYIGICMQLKRETRKEINWALPCRSSCLHCVLRKRSIRKIHSRKSIRGNPATSIFAQIVSQLSIRRLATGQLSSC